MLIQEEVTRKDKRKIAYFYNEKVFNYHYGEKHPMKPHRLSLTHNLIFSYGLHKHMSLFRTKKATREEILSFHSEDYFDFLKKISVNPKKILPLETKAYNIGPDTPLFPEVLDFSLLYTGASVAAARHLVTNNRGEDIAINWSGGLHHAKKYAASGFCYLNDIVVSIIELLKYYPRILYIDIDVHHGDGVQEAFYLTDRVMTLSFHKYDSMYFPGTGSLNETGIKEGKNYSLNVPLESGIDDYGYDFIFKPIVESAIQTYKPLAIVLQCGADSLAGDRLGVFNLSIRGHGECVRYIETFKIPLLVLGGGGYVSRNVARCWTYETSVLLGIPIENQIPKSLYLDYFEPSGELHIDIVKTENKNDRKTLESTRNSLLETIRELQGAPCIQFTVIPKKEDL